jgi:hypothetical protein
MEHGHLFRSVVATYIRHIVYPIRIVHKPLKDFDIQSTPKNEIDIVMANASAKKAAAGMSNRPHDEHCW